MHVYGFKCSQLNHKMFDGFEGCCPLVVSPQTELKLSYLVKHGWINCTHAVKIKIKYSCTSKLFCLCLTLSLLFCLVPLQQSMRENKEKQALGDLMIKPVQRIPRYELLVKVTLTFPFYFCLFVPVCFLLITCIFMYLGWFGTHQAGLND